MPKEHKDKRKTFLTEFLCESKAFFTLEFSSKVKRAMPLIRKKKALQVSKAFQAIKPK